MFDVGFWELALISVVALLIIGPERLPQAVRTAGLWIGKGRRMLLDVKADIDREIREHTPADIDTLKKDIESAGGQFKEATDVKTEMERAATSLKETFETASPLNKDTPSAVAGKKTTKKKSTGAKTTKNHSKSKSANGVSFYIYENWQAGPHKAVIHIGSCAFCNEGKGRAGGYDPKHAKWHGPFDGIETARRQQKAIVAKVKKECGVCMKRTFT